MQLVIDANTIFSALIKNGVTSDLIVDNSLTLDSVEFLFTEFEKYKDMIKEKVIEFIEKNTK